MQFWCEGVLVGTMPNLMATDDQRLGGFERRHTLSPSLREVSVALSTIEGDQDHTYWIDLHNIPEAAEARIDGDQYIWSWYVFKISPQTLDDIFDLAGFHPA